MEQIIKAVIIIYMVYLMVQSIIAGRAKEWDKATFYLAWYIVLSRAIDILLGCR